MTKYELKKKQALCDVINMKFNEANELFEAETLESMQMAQMCGGSTPGPIAIPLLPKGISLVSMLIEYANGLDSFTNLWRKFMGNDTTPPPSTSSVDVRYNDKGQIESLTVVGQVDSVITDQVKIYGVGNNGYAPTPLTNPSDGTTDMP